MFLILPLTPPPPHRLTCGQEHIKSHTSFGGGKKELLSKLRDSLPLSWNLSLSLSVLQHFHVFFFKFGLLSSPLNLKPYQHYFTLTWTVIPHLQLPASFHLVICYFLKSLFPIFNLSTPNLIVSGTESTWLSAPLARNQKPLWFKTLYLICLGNLCKVLMITPKHFLYELYLLFLASIT